MKVLAIIGDKEQAGAVEIYRITSPFTKINNNRDKWRCSWVPLGDVFRMMKSGRASWIYDHDVIVLHRLLTDKPERSEGLVDSLRFGGAEIVYEADDDYSGLHRPADLREGATWQPFVGNADAITVTTKGLERLALEESGGRPVYVLPNAIERDMFLDVARDTERLYSDELTVMLAGTRTHYDDWKVLEPVIPAIQADYPGVRFLVAANPAHYDYLDALEVQWLKPVPYPAYPTLLAQADILCAPLVPNDPFNHCKSNIKAVEAWCAARQVHKTRQGGCCVLASNCKAYRGTVENRHNGLLVEHTPEAWEAAIRKVLENRLLRQELQIEGFKDSRRYDIENHWIAWYRAYKDIGGRQ